MQYKGFWSRRASSPPYNRIFIELLDDKLSKSTASNTQALMFMVVVSIESMSSISDISTS